MSDPKSNKKKQYPNPLEALRELGRDTAKSAKEDLFRPIPENIKSQIFSKTEKNYSGEIMPGQALEVNEVYTGKRETEEKLQKQLVVERRLREEDRVLVERRTNELRIQIQAIHQEIYKIVEVTPELTREVEIAAIQAPGDPSTYELFFLERLFEFIKSFRKRIHDANVWLHSANRRSMKKNVWGRNYKKHGAKYLLSGEHYASRSAA